MLCALVLSGLPLAGAAALSPPDHPLHFGYYGVDGKNGDYWADVAAYTNLYVATIDNYSIPQNLDGSWVALLNGSMAEAASRGQAVMVSLGLHREYAEPEVILAIAEGQWASVKYLELADEPEWDVDETEWRIAAARAAMARRGLAPVPLGIVYPREHLDDPNLKIAPSLDWVGIECYVEPPGHRDRRANVNDLDAYLDRVKRRIPADKKLILVMMAYDRNGAWSDPETLAALQAPVYRHAMGDSRVLAITLFSYGRPGGTRDYSQLRRAHRAIGEAILSYSPPAATVADDGPAADGVAAPRELLSVDVPAQPDPNAVRRSPKAVSVSEPSPRAAMRSALAMSPATGVVPEKMAQPLSTSPAVTPEADQTSSGVPRTGWRWLLLPRPAHARGSRCSAAAGGDLVAGGCVVRGATWRVAVRSVARDAASGTYLGEVFAWDDDAPSETASISVAVE